MIKVHYYATINCAANGLCKASIIEANSKTQIKRAQMRLFEETKAFDTYNEAYNYIQERVDEQCISRFNVINY